MNADENNYHDDDNNSILASTTITDTNNIHEMSTYLAVLLGGIAVAIFVAFAVFVGWIVLRNIRQKVRDGKEERQRKCVYPYLQNLDANDVDIRRAPTGGWHGTYLNKLANGVNECETGKAKKPRDGDTDDDDSEDTIVIEDCLHKSNFSIDDDIIDDIIRNGGALGDGRRSKSSLFADSASSVPYCLGDEADAREKALVDNETFGLLVLPDGSNGDGDLEGFDRSEHRAISRSFKMTDDTI